jgi:DNA-binding transcriptional ArsR family regulator
MDRQPDFTAAADEPVVVTVGQAAPGVRRAVGPAAWCALEVLAATPAHVGGEMWIVQCSVRGVAARLGVAPNTAQRALAALRRAGLITATQEREGGGRFGGTAYRLTVDPSVLGRHTRDALGVNTPMIAPQPRVASKPVVALGQQLVLLPSV